LEIRHRDGHTTPVLYNASVYRHKEGASPACLPPLEDITGRQAGGAGSPAAEPGPGAPRGGTHAQLKRAAAELEKRNLEVERVNRMRPIFWGAAATNCVRR